MDQVVFKKRISALTAAVVLVWSGMSHAAWPELHGFLETDAGVKVSDDNTKKDNFNLLEQRLQLKSLYYFEGENYFSKKGASLNFKGDFTVDEYFDGKTDFDLRELNLSLTPFDFMDVRAGRQVLTWGTGDYLFINDMFPKDYRSFFIGRNDEYLKKPFDALKMSFYPSWGSVDFVTAAFEPNTTAKGDRLSFYDSFQMGIAGINSDRDLHEPSLDPSNAEYSLRYYRSLGSNELALYYFNGFDKNPTSYRNEATRQLFYRRLDVYGWSLRGPFAEGIGNVEFGYYYSREDTDGSDRLIANSMLKFMGGYTRDLKKDVTLGFQYLYEQRMDYDSYLANRLATDLLFDERRHLLTQSISKLYKNQTVRASLFNFYSPTDADGYVRMSASYDVTDQWKVTLGGNLPWGEDDMTEFGQMKKNKNVFLRARYSF